MPKLFCGLGSVATKSPEMSTHGDVPAAEPALLAWKEDHYGGIIIDPKSLPSGTDLFLCSLQRSMSLWRSQGKMGIWLKLPIENSELVPVAVKEGFVYHHAERDYLMLNYWLPGIPSTLPDNASHTVGVGALVINEKKEILVVQEKSGPTKGTGMWKMITGVVKQGEDILAGVQREVKEETGVDAEFVELVGVRQSHNTAFGKSDLFMICLVHPSSTEITKQDSEIETAKWMPVDEFRMQPFNAASSMMLRVCDIIDACIERQYAGFLQELLNFGFRGKGAYFYHNRKCLTKLS